MDMNPRDQAALDQAAARLRDSVLSLPEARYRNLLDEVQEFADPESEVYIGQYGTSDMLLALAAALAKLIEIRPLNPEDLT
jgi:hypothetical protein